MTNNDKGMCDRTIIGMPRYACNNSLKSRTITSYSARSTTSQLSLFTLLFLLLPTKCLGSIYQFRTSGSCPGDDIIESKEECQQAAIVMGMSGTTVELEDYSYHPFGCFFKEINTDLFTQKDLIFNSNSNGIYACSFQKQCICSLTCQIGTYEDPSSNTCIPCSDGFTCPDGISQVMCQTGFFCNDGKTIPCPVGKFGNEKQQHDQGAACHNCTVGRFNIVPGRTFCPQECSRGKYGIQLGGISENACINCEKGTMCQYEALTEPDDCGKGTYQDEPGQTSCKDCPANTYSDETSKQKTSSKDCKQCPSGKTTIGIGKKSINECIIKTVVCETKGNAPDEKGVCKQCPSGRKANEGTQCVLCPRGFAQENTGQTECIPCDTEMCRITLGATSATTSATSTTFQLIHPSKNDTTTVVDQLHNSPKADQTMSDLGIDPNTSNIINALLATTIATLVCTHRIWPMKWKIVDLIFAGSHYIDDSHALRMFDTRLGAALTLALPFIAVGMAIPTLFSSNLQITEGFKPFFSVPLPFPQKGDAFQQLEMNVTTQAFVPVAAAFACDDKESGIILVEDASSSLTCTKTSMRSMSSDTTVGMTTCALTVVCDVSGTITGTEQVTMKFPSSFQTIAWSSTPSPWNDKQVSLQHVLSPSDGKILSGNEKTPSILSFGALRSKKFDVREYPPVGHTDEYGIQLSWSGTEQEETRTGSPASHHFVAFQFKVKDNVYETKWSDKLNLLTRFSTVLTLLLSVMSGMRMFKIYFELLIDKCLVARARRNNREPPADVLLRVHVLREHAMKERSGNHMKTEQRLPATGMAIEMTSENLHANPMLSSSSLLPSALEAASLPSPTLSNVVVQEVEKMKKQMQTMQKEHDSELEELRAIVERLSVKLEEDGTRSSGKVTIQILIDKSTGRKYSYNATSGETKWIN